jgi:AbrB family looped-hinge helix DNA binding protein
MAKVTSKLQVTIPKAVAERYGIRPGDEIDFQPAGDFIRVIPPGRARSRRIGLEERLRLFDEGTARQVQREKGMRVQATAVAGRGWTREDLYTRGEPD